MRGLLSIIATFAAAFAGCSFSPAGGGVVDDDAAVELDAAGEDAAPTDDAAIDATAVAPLCDANDATLRACFTFTGGAVTNGAGTSLSITSQNVTQVVGPVGDAVGVGATSVIHIDETPALELVGPYTFEAFVRLDSAPPASGRFGIYDENGEWGVFVNDQRQVYCSNGPVFGSALALGTWTHVACVYDRQNVLVYVGGELAAMTPLTGDLTIAAADGGNLGQDCRTGGVPGDPLLGALDEVRIWATARTAAQIAAAAAR